MARFQRRTVFKLEDGRFVLPVLISVGGKAVCLVGGVSKVFERISDVLSDGSHFLLQPLSPEARRIRRIHELNYTRIARKRKSFLKLSVVRCGITEAIDFSADMDILCLRTVIPPVPHRLMQPEPREDRLICV